jgi:hypothetical protein
VRKPKEFYDMEGIRAQKVYEQNPEAQFQTKERMAILARITRENPLECKYAYYLKMSLVDGYTVREIANIEKEPSATIQQRINQVTLFIRNQVRTQF